MRDVVEGLELVKAHLDVAGHYSYICIIAQKLRKDGKISENAWRWIRTNVIRYLDEDKNFHIIDFGDYYLDKYPEQVEGLTDVQLCLLLHTARKGWIDEQISELSKELT